MGLPPLISGDKTSSTWSSKTPASSLALDPDIPSDLIYDEIQLPCIPPERPDLRDLNNSLEALAVVFPDVQIEVFRELLANFDGESRLFLVADALLKNRVAWVKGRWKIDANAAGNSNNGNNNSNSSGERSIVPRADIFRSKEYKKAARALALYEFKGLSKSTINAVLAESNYSYLLARETLVTLSSRSWRFTISSIFMRRKPVVANDLDNHPLVRWRSSGQSATAIPCIRATGSAELDRELYEALIQPIHQRRREEREAQDRQLALRLNTQEAEEAGAVHECACCFTTAPFEEFTHCNRDAHMICFRCVQHSVQEALFGQGWLGSVIPETGALRCMAVGAEECAGCISSDHIRRAMAEEKKGPEILERLDQRLAEHSLLASGLPLIHCPFCNYVEIDDIYTPVSDARLRLKATGILGALLLALCAGPFVLTLPFALAASAACLLLTSTHPLRSRLSAEWADALSRHRRRRRGLQFACQDPRCGRVSCLSCSKAWTDIHVCNESSLVALRTEVEQAMSMAIKRVCPRCNTSFVKNAGCNKLTCPCGYKMCYVCRADLADEGYRHFCDHFRPDGDPTACLECDRCNLWESEDTDRVLLEAREEAERKWRELEKRDLSNQEKAFLQTGIASRTRGISLEGVVAVTRLSSWAEIFDLIVETIFL
ncbi:E3 ubiquitin-protein ligase [Escovopsis weberi]|uniref:E3 ubiquitin-protein ligase n=1 Tax=Escovopsis weberi TaxID=150374 RepID=A0A0M8MT32_ESCWE|nr:E3 ubiquitin-protein ligase [Escovopsis weberi]